MKYYFRKLKIKNLNNLEFAVGKLSTCIMIDGIYVIKKILEYQGTAVMDLRVG